MDSNKPKRRRARLSDGKFKKDDPQTAVNEAWEPVPVEDELVSKNENKYAVKPKIDGTSTSAGKYDSKPKVRPTFGGVTSETY